MIKIISIKGIIKNASQHNKANNITFCNRSTYACKYAYIHSRDFFYQVFLLSSYDLPWSYILSLHRSHTTNLNLKSYSILKNKVPSTVKNILFYFKLITVILFKNSKSLSLILSLSQLHVQYFRSTGIVLWLYICFIF